MTGPLDGVRVLEVANWLAVPAGVALLADMGAEVIKVEPPAGDAWRGFRMASVGYPGEFAGNYVFEADNRGKRGITLNLDAPEGRDIVARLAESADVLVTNLIPSRAERYGITYAALSARNPRLIFAHFTGYGVAGPERDRLGFDYAAFWARSGIMGLVGEEGGAPPLQRPGMGDHTTALAIACGIIAALFERERSGRGQEVDFSLVHTGLWVLSTDVQAALLARANPSKHDRTAPANPIWNTYRCADRSWLLLVMPQPDPYWPKVCAAIGRPELVDDPRFDSLDARARNSRELVAILEGAFASAPREEWGRRLDAHGVIWAPVQSMTEVITDPQARANGAFAAINHPSLGTFETVAPPFRFGRSRVEPRGPAPELGQHTEEVLLEAGYSWEEIAALREQGAF